MKTSTPRPSTSKLFGSARPLALLAVASSPLLTPLARAQDEPVAAAASVPTTAVATLTPEQQAQGTSLIEEALGLAESESGLGFSRTRLAAVRGASSLIPLLEAPARDQILARWMRLSMAGGVSREARLDAFSDFFDVATRANPEFARGVAGRLAGDDAARAGAFVALSERAEKYNWKQANDYALAALYAAREEEAPRIKARSMTFVALRMATLNPELRPLVVSEASATVRATTRGRERDYLLAEVAGAAAKFDLGLARRIASTIGDEGLKNLAVARANLSEISQTTLSVATQDRVSALAKAAARYDVRALPILLQLPPQSDVLRAMSDALPPVYPSARPAISASTLERVWGLSQTAEPSVYKDQLQSRLARLMILHDLWRGRAWGNQLAWKGGRVQAGAFLNAVSQSRQSGLKLQVEPLQELAGRNISRAITQARTLAPSARAEALLLLAGQVLA